MHAAGWGAVEAATRCKPLAQPLAAAAAHLVAQHKAQRVLPALHSLDQPAVHKHDAARQAARVHVRPLDGLHCTRRGRVQCSNKQEGRECVQAALCSTGKAAPWMQPCLPCCSGSPLHVLCHAALTAHPRALQRRTPHRAHRAAPPPAPPPAAGCTYAAGREDRDSASAYQALLRVTTRNPMKCQRLQSGIAQAPPPCRRRSPAAPACSAGIAPCPLGCWPGRRPRWSGKTWPPRGPPLHSPGMGTTRAKREASLKAQAGGGQLPGQAGLDPACLPPAPALHHSMHPFPSQGMPYCMPYFPNQHT